jgi:hypothetical protein
MRGVSLDGRLRMGFLVVTELAFSGNVGSNIADVSEPVANFRKSLRSIYTLT